MARLPVPQAPSRSSQTVDVFWGVDYTNDESNVDVRRSPCAPNMIRDVPGKVRKCMGYEKIHRYDGAVNGAWSVRYKDEAGLLVVKDLIHCGTVLYDQKSQALLKTGMADNRSRAWQMGAALYIQDGKSLYKYDGKIVKDVREIAYIPTLTIAKSPGGGGKSYEPLNLIQPKFTEKFLSDGKSAAYSLSLQELDETEVEVMVLNASGGWDAKKEGTDFSVDRKTGIVTFTSPPGNSPVTGEDNVKITASKTVKEYANQVLKCTTGILFGVSGVPDRLFVGGHPTRINHDWYSGQNDATYWPDTGYSVLGSAQSSIMGYSIVNNFLATYKDVREADRNIIIRAGNLVDNEPAFPIHNTLQGPGTVAKWSFGALETEPLSLTNLGVYALTTSDISGERYSQNRSFFVDGALLRCTDLQQAYACVYRDMYWLCVGKEAYILDGLQSMPTDRQKPYSTRQYACFHRTNLPARVMWEQDERLFFGTEDGTVYRFYDEVDEQKSYQDDGAAIDAFWETPELSGRDFYKNKTFRYLAVKVGSAVATSLIAWGQVKGIWQVLKREERKARYFNYSQLVYSKFTYSNDRTSRTLHLKTKIKRVDKTRYRFQNDKLNEPFQLMAWAIELQERGYFKG